MASIARKALDGNVKDVERLLRLHEQEGGTKRGRRYGLEVLNKSAIVLITAYWESYCEDIASEALAHIVKHTKTAESLPKELRKQVAGELKDDKNELAVWTIADDGWKAYVKSRLLSMQERRNRKLNTPKAANIDDLFSRSLGLQKMSDRWKLARNMPARECREKLDGFVELRGSIAHRGNAQGSVTKQQVVDYLDFIRRLAAITGGAVNSHVKGITGRPLWKATQRQLN